MFNLTRQVGLSFLVGISALIFTAISINPAIALEPVEVAKLLASDGADSDQFGRQIAIDGDTVVFSAAWNDELDTNSGAAYVFMRDGTSWVEQAKLTASDGAAYDYFGWSVALDGDTIVIGANNGNQYNGAAYVFIRDGTNWFEQAKLTASDGAGGDDFGVSVAVDGDTIVIGASKDDNLGIDSGSAYVFVRDGTNWVEQVKLLASDGATADWFGLSVALDGDTVVIGAPWDDDLYAPGGAAYVFVQDGTNWFEQAKLSGCNCSGFDFFGTSIKVNGDIVVIGASRDDDLGSNSGAAYVFVRDGTNWFEQAKLTASDGEAADLFGGSSVGENGDIIVIGAPGDDDLGIDSGSAYVFVRDGTNWFEQAKLTASDGEAADAFGSSIVIDGNKVIVGARGDDDLGSNSGSVYVFSLLSNITPPGENVVVQPQPVDEGGNPIEDAPDISFTFEDITEGGETTVVVTEPGAGTTSAPSGFRITGLIGAPVLFDIETTATLAEGSSFVVCFDYSGMNVAGSPDNLTLAHEVDGKWTDITISNDTTNMIICGEADSFSYFAILESLEIFGPTDPIALGAEVPLGIDVGDLTFTDTVHWEWGDGSTTDAVASTNEIVTAHTYAEAGVYTVTATLMLAGIEAGSAEFQYVVVYDPTAGFITGGGWFDSPAGAYLADSGLVGRANFGFVSKYKKGAIIPTGNTEFQFKAGYLSFRSLEYQWLVIAGSRAQFKGVGTINGVGNFGFMLTAVDEALTPSTDIDLFRIKIWDIDNGDGVVYDNGLGDADGGDAATAIGGGSIVIHKAK